MRKKHVSLLLRRFFVIYYMGGSRILEMDLFWGEYVNCRAQAYNGGLGALLQWGSGAQGQRPWSGVMGMKPLN